MGNLHIFVKRAVRFSHTAADRNMRLFTFGICTEEQGRYLNLGLSRFKEGFGTEFCVNRLYEKILR